MIDELLQSFAANVGKYFNVRNTPLYDEIAGIDEKYRHVVGKTYGHRGAARFMLLCAN